MVKKLQNYLLDASHYQGIFKAGSVLHEAMQRVNGNSLQLTDEVSISLGILLGSYCRISPPKSAEPIDEEWLESLGFEHETRSRAGDMGDYYELWNGEEDNRCLLVLVRYPKYKEWWAYVDWDLESAWPYPLTTRLQLIRLLQAILA